MGLLESQALSRPLLKPELCLFFCIFTIFYKIRSYVNSLASTPFMGFNGWQNFPWARRGTVDLWTVAKQFAVDGQFYDFFTLFCDSIGSQLLRCYIKRNELHFLKG